jgi:cell wall assembly regulator SMI1
MRQETREALDRHFAPWPEAWGGEVPDAEIAEAEDQLGVTFPADYRAFVRWYGGGVVGPAAIVGLRAAPFLNEDPPTVVGQTERWRQELPDELRDWLVVGLDVDGNPIGFRGTNPQVVVFDHDFGGEIELAADFEAFLWQLLAEVHPD